MKRKLLCGLLALMIQTTDANDAVGYVNTGGVQYLKSKDIVMQEEDLFISQKSIRVHYKFKNLSNKDVQENILFPLPKIENGQDGLFADTEGLLDDFQVRVNGEKIRPERHVRTYYEKQNGEFRDVTEVFKRCGLTDFEMMSPWSNDQEFKRRIADTLDQCKQAGLPKQGRGWFYTEIIYSWPQTFKAGSITEVYHEYQPLVGGSAMTAADLQREKFCVDNAFLRGLTRLRQQQDMTGDSTLGYVLTTGAQWAQPIQKFRMVIEKEPNQLVSFCWKGQGKVKKLNNTQFEVTETNFLPTHDLDVIYVGY